MLIGLCFALSCYSKWPAWFANPARPVFLPDPVNAGLELGNRTLSDDVSAGFIAGPYLATQNKTSIAVPLVQVEEVKSTFALQTGSVSSPFVDSGLLPGKIRARMETESNTLQPKLPTMHASHLRRELHPQTDADHGQRSRTDTGAM